MLGGFGGSLGLLLLYSLGGSHGLWLLGNFCGSLVFLLLGGFGGFLGFILLGKITGHFDSLLDGTAGGSIGTLSKCTCWIIWEFDIIDDDDDEQLDIFSSHLREYEFISESIWEHSPIESLSELYFELIDVFEVFLCWNIFVSWRFTRYGVAESDDIDRENLGTSDLEESIPCFEFIFGP